MANYWIKLYNEILDDPKMATLPDTLWRRVIELFLFAGKLYSDGILPDTKQIAWGLRMNENTLETELKQLVTTGIIEKTETGWFIPKFKQRQDPMTGKERTAQFRKKEQLEQYNGNVTELKQNVTQITDNKLHKTDNITDTKKSDNHFFVGEFLRISEILGLASEYQGIALVKLKDKYGEARLLQYAEWCKSKEMLTMDEVLKAAIKALDNWKEKPTIPEKQKKKYTDALTGEVFYE
jgi:DNA-binding transcriptional regulator YhcF (GntR family)